MVSLSAGQPEGRLFKGGSLIGRLVAFFLLGEVRPGWKLMEGLGGLMLHDFVFELDVPVESILSAVQPVAVLMWALHFLHDILLAASLELFAILALSFLDSSDLLEHFKHDTLLFLGLCYLSLQEVSPLGQEGELFGGMNGDGHEDVLVVEQ
jgi:hypothetical protein